MTSDPLIGSRLVGRYDLTRLVGEGRTGRVYAGMDRQERRKVAVKVLHRSLCAVEEEVKRFQREFEATTRIDHPNSVQMYEFGADNDVHYLVMEFLEGRRLSSLLEGDRSLGVRKSVEITLAIAAALEAAHEVGVYHRDVNPANVMLCKVGQRRDHVKVLDFGIARLRGSSENLTDIGTRLGSAHYMAPEYINHTTVDRRTDLYALGCVLYAMLVGEPPFVGRSIKVLDGHVTKQPVAPSVRVPGIPTWLDSTVLRLLAKDPDRRPQHARDLVENLASHLENIVEAKPIDELPSDVRQAPRGVIHAGLAHTGTGSQGMRDPTRTDPSAAVFRRPRRLGARYAILAVLLFAGTLVGSILTWWWMG